MSDIPCLSPPRRLIFFPIRDFSWSVSFSVPPGWLRRCDCFSISYGSLGNSHIWIPRMHFAVSPIFHLRLEGRRRALYTYICVLCKVSVVSVSSSFRWGVVAIPSSIDGITLINIAAPAYFLEDKSNIHLYFLSLDVASDICIVFDFRIFARSYGDYFLR